MFLKERTPKSVKEVTEMAEVYVAAHGGQFKATKQNHRQGVVGNRPAQIDSRKEKQSAQKSVYPSFRDRKPVEPCYLCGKKRHIAKDCWSKNKS